MVSGNDLTRSGRAIDCGLFCIDRHGTDEGYTAEELAIVQVQLQTAILTELVAAREDRAARRAGPNIKIGG